MPSTYPQIILAPMEGVIDHTMRALLARLGGVDRCVTEFLRVSQELQPARVFYRICPELRHGGTTDTGVPVYLQLLGGDPDLLAAHAARAMDLGAPGVDLNFGCPAKTVNKSDGGAILLREPERVYRIVDAVRRAFPPPRPLTVKIRLGFQDRSQFLEVVSAVDSAAPDQLAIHARTRADGYRPPAYWSEIARAKQVCRTPIVANGEIWSVEDAIRARAQSGVDALMLGRGALCRPDLPRLLRAHDLGEAHSGLDWSSIVALVLDHLDTLLAHYDRRYVVNPIKQWLGYLRHYYPQASRFFEHNKRIKDASQMRLALLGEIQTEFPTEAQAKQSSERLSELRTDPERALRREQKAAKAA
ncbi:MAG: tRNA-dihydrouridine synthase [Pseudomonadota bacterium]